LRQRGLGQHQKSCRSKSRCEQNPHEHAPYSWGVGF
jgi:hypothetical protein